MATDVQGEQKTTPPSQKAAKHSRWGIVLRRYAPFLIIGFFSLVLGPLFWSAISATLSSNQIADSIDISSLGVQQIEAAPQNAAQQGVQPGQGIASPGTIPGQHPTDFHQRQLNAMLADYDRVAQAHEDILTAQRAHAWKLFALQKCQQMNVRQAGSCQGPMDFLVMRLESERNKLLSLGKAVAPTADGEAIVYKNKRDTRTTDAIRQSKTAIKEISMALATPGEQVPSDQIDMSQLVEVTNQLLNHAHQFRNSH